VNPNQKNLTKQPVKTGKKTRRTPTRGRQDATKNKNNKQKPPNTLLSSQTTHPAPPPGRAANPRPKAACSSYGQVERSEVRRHSLRMPPRSADEPRRNDFIKLRQALTRVKSHGHQTTLTFVTVTQHVPRRRHSASRAAKPATGRAGSGPRSPPSPHCPPGRC